MMLSNDSAKEVCMCVEREKDEREREKESTTVKY